MLLNSPTFFAHVQECKGPYLPFCLLLNLLTLEWPCVLDSKVSKIAEDFATADSEAFEWGDRRQEIVFIGIGMDQKKIVALLDSCLLTPEEMVTYRSQAAEQVLNSQVPARQTNPRNPRQPRGTLVNLPSKSHAAPRLCPCIAPSRIPNSVPWTAFHCVNLKARMWQGAAQVGP